MWCLPMLHLSNKRKEKEKKYNDLAVLLSHNSIQGFSGIEFGISFPTSCSVQFLFL